MVQPPRNEKGQFVAFKVRTEQNFGAVKTAAENASFRNIGHAAASIRKDALASIQYSKVTAGTIRVKNKKGRWKTVKYYKPSPAGSPPFTHRPKSKYFNRGLRYDVTGLSAVIGPAASVFGQVMKAHEFGGSYKGATYPERPFMGPALERATPRFAQSFQGAIRS